jgi:general secretion pathway protein M
MFNFSKREKNVLMTGGILVVLFIAIGFIYLPAVDQRNELARVLAVEQTSFGQMIQLQKKYNKRVQPLNDQSDREIRALKTREKGFSLFAFLDIQAEKSGIKPHIDNMKPFLLELKNSPYKLSKVTLKLKSIFLNDLIQFIKQIETSGKGVQIISLSLSKTGKKEDRLDALIETQTLIFKEPV